MPSTAAQQHSSTATTYQGQPCEHGHAGMRYTSSRACVECVRGRAAAQVGESTAAQAIARKVRRALTDLLPDQPRRHLTRDAANALGMTIPPRCAYCGRVSLLRLAWRDGHAQAPSLLWVCRPCMAERGGMTDSSYRFVADLPDVTEWE